MERGNEIEVPKYTIRPFLMQNTEGRQPMSEQVMFLNFNKISKIIFQSKLFLKSQDPNFKIFENF